MRLWQVRDDPAREPKTVAARSNEPSDAELSIDQSRADAATPGQRSTTRSCSGVKETLIQAAPHFIIL